MAPAAAGDTVVGAQSNPVTNVFLRSWRSEKWGDYQTFSSAVMVRLHKVYGNLMVDLKPTNAKLVRRAIRLTALATGADETAAQAALEASGFQVKVAIVAIARRLSPADARARLAAVHGSVRAALAD